MGDLLDWYKKHPEDARKDKRYTTAIHWLFGIAVVLLVLALGFFYFSISSRPGFDPWMLEEYSADSADADTAAITTPFKPDGLWTEKDTVLEIRDSP